MTHKWTRRDVLWTSSCAAVTLGYGSWQGLSPVNAAQTRPRPLRHADDARIERLAERIIESDPNRVVELVATELENGLSRQHFLAANFVAGIRYQGHHYAYVAHPVNVVANAIPAEVSLLPLFYHLESLKVRSGRERLRKLDESKMPAIGIADESFQRAMAESDHEMASLSFLALAREYGPRRAYHRLWMYGAGRNHRSGGHTAISVINTFRTLQAIDWRCPETVLQFAVEDSAVGKAGGDDLHLVNQERAARVDEFPRNWASSRSQPEVVLELVDLYREGRPGDACRRTFDRLQQGTVQAGSVWDAVFLTTAELVTRYQWVGSKMLAGHSVTCSNALHFMYRTVTDPATRLYAMLEAVEWTTSFLNRERARPALRGRDILALAAADKHSSLEEIFATIPARPRHQFAPMLLPDADQACALAFAWAQHNSDHTHFLQEALRLLCLKSTTEVHDFKYPLALFENHRYASDEWKPHLLAASVYVLHGTDMADAPMIKHARERLGLS